MNKAILDKMSIKLFGWVLLPGLLALLIGCGEKAHKVAYVENLKLYNSFTAKKELEAKLLEKKSANKLTLDSLRLLVSDEQSTLYYQKELAERQSEEERLAISYDNQIWNQLNSYVQEYGKAKGYDFIYGATGNGAMMYAREGLNITDEVILYVNEQYEGN